MSRKPGKKTFSPSGATGLQETAGATGIELPSDGRDLLPFHEMAEGYKALFETANDAILLIKGEIVVGCNPKALVLFGGGKNEIVGQTLTRLSSPVQADDRDSRDSALKRVKAALSGEPQLFEWRHCRLDGTPFDAEVSLSGVRAGHEALVLGIVRDITDRKRSERVVRERERTYRELAELLPQTIVEIGEKGYFTFINRTGLDTLGYTPEDLARGIHYLSAVAPEDHARIREETMRLLGGANTGGGEYTMVRKDGGTFPGVIFAGPVNREGRPAGVRAILIDVSGRRRAQEALRKSEEALLAMINATQEGLFMIDREGLILVGNEVFADRLGSSVKELAGTPFYDHYPPEVAARRKEYFDRVVSSGETAQFEDARGGKVYQVYAYPVFGTDGRTGRVAVFERDITHLKEAETALSESEERYRLTLENSPDAIILHDGEKFIYLNPAALKLYGIQDKEGLTGKRVLDHIHPDDRQVLADRTCRTDRTTIPLSLREIRIIRGSGEAVPVDVTLGIMNYHGERVFQILFRDIAKRKEAERALKDSEERYRNIFENAMVGIFRTTKDGRHINMNPALARIHGYTSPREMMEVMGDNNVQLYVNQEDRLRYARELESHGYLQGFVVELYKRDRSTVWVAMNVRRVRDSEGRTLYDEGIVEDITERKTAVDALRKRERDLETESALLNEANAALKVLLRHRDEDRTALENTIMANVKDLVFPYIEKLNASHPGKEQKALLNVLESNLNSILSPFLQKMNAVYSRFTPTEIQVANLIRNGKSTKEIADLLNVSAGTVSSHRNSIRHKLGFRNKQVNLMTYLMSL